MMMSQNQTGKDGKPFCAPNDDAVRNTVEPTEIKRELTDEEIATVAGGIKGVIMRPLNPQPLPP